MHKSFFIRIFLYFFYSFRKKIVLNSLQNENVLFSSECKSIFVSECLFLANIFKVFFRNLIISLIDQINLLKSQFKAAAKKYRFQVSHGLTLFTKRTPIYVQICMVVLEFRIRKP